MIVQELKNLGPWLKNYKSNKLYDLKSPQTKDLRAFFAKGQVIFIAALNKARRRFVLGLAQEKHPSWFVS
jgi:hypothetical protein